MIARSAASGLLFVLLASAACGGGSPPPPAHVEPTADAGPASKPSASGDDEMKPFAGVDLGEPPPASSSSSTAAPPPSAPEPKDECTPVGIDFEKRARPKMKECYRDAKKKEPDLKGTVRISVAIDMLGKIKSVKITEKTLPDPVAKCMLDVVKKTPLPESSKCPGKEITIPMTFPTH